MRLCLFIFICILQFFYISSAVAKGFTADWVDIQHLQNEKYRVIIKYTNLEIAEYSRAFVDFKTKEEAIDVFQKLAKGAYFYWGDNKKIYFEKENGKLNPY